MREGKTRSRSENERGAGRPRPGWCRRFGGWGLGTWLAGGVVLEAFHGFKLAPYLEDPLRREMWTLAHAHGTLLSLAAVVLGWAGPLASLPASRAVTCDRLFAAGALLVPLGFLLGGIFHSEADPGLGVLLVPVGGLLAFGGILAWVLPVPARGGDDL